MGALVNWELGECEAAERGARTLPIASLEILLAEIYSQREGNGHCAIKKHHDSA